MANQAFKHYVYLVYNAKKQWIEVKYSKCQLSLINTYYTYAFSTSSLFEYYSEYIVMFIKSINQKLKTMKNPNYFLWKQMQWLKTFNVKLAQNLQEWQDFYF